MLPPPMTKWLAKVRLRMRDNWRGGAEVSCILLTMTRNCLSRVRHQKLHAGEYRYRAYAPGIKAQLIGMASIRDAANWALDWKWRLMSCGRMREPSPTNAGVGIPKGTSVVDHATNTILAYVTDDVFKQLKALLDPLYYLCLWVHRRLGRLFTPFRCWPTWNWQT